MCLMRNAIVLLLYATHTAAPKLCDLTEEELKLFVSHSVPVATKARHDHNEELRILRQPWWKKLGDEYQDEKLAEESEGWKLF